jgi:hypothetical protein
MKLKLMMPFSSLTFWSWRVVLNWPGKRTRNLLIQVISLHYKSNRPHHTKRGVVHGLISQAKVICHDQKDFNNEIKNIRHDRMLNEYPQEFGDSIIKL